MSLPFLAAVSEAYLFKECVMPLPIIANPDSFNMVGKELASYKEVVKRVRDKQMTIQANVDRVISSIGLSESTKELYKEYLRSDKKLSKAIVRAYKVLDAPKTASRITTALFMAARGVMGAKKAKSLGANNYQAAGIGVRSAVLGFDNQLPGKFIFNMVSPFVAGYIGGKIGVAMIKSPSDMSTFLNRLLEETRTFAQAFISTAKSQERI